MSEDTTQISGASALSGVLATGPGVGASAPERRARLAELASAGGACVRCPQLVSARTQVVFGSGDPDADLMLVGESPGTREDEAGVPFVGASGRVLGELLGSIGLRRADVYVTNVLKCRPPGNRDPAPAEISRCRPYLEEQVALVQPRVVCTLGNFSTRLLRDDNAGITALHGRAELITLGGRTMYLLPLFHPAAALYTRALLDTLRDDILSLPELLSRPAPPQPQPDPPLPIAVESGLDDRATPEPSVGAPPAAEEVVESPAAPDPPGPGQLGLF